MKNAPGLNPRNFTAMVRLDHNRALSQLAEKTGTHVNDLRKPIIWGNHSATQYPDLHHATVDGKPALSLVDAGWYAETFIPVVQQRGAAIIKARGASSAASARHRPRSITSATGCWARPTATGSVMAVPSDGSYGIPAGVIYGYPVTCSGGKYQIVQGLAVNEFSRARMDATHKELLEERDGVKDLKGGGESSIWFLVVPASARWCSRISGQFAHCERDATAARLLLYAFTATGRLPG